MNEERYGEVLKEIRPRIIDSAEEHERLLSVAESMMEKGEALGEEEREALALVIVLIKAFEEQVMDDEDEEEEEGTHDDEAPPAPHVALQRLMASHQLEVSDVAPIFGTPRQAQEVLEGKRPISRNQAKELSRYFRVPAKLFQE